MDHNHFTIDNEDAIAAIITLLVDNMAITNALTEFVLKTESERSGEDFNSLTAHFGKTTAFHKEQVLKRLFSQYASLGDIFENKKDE